MKTNNKAVMITVGIPIIATILSATILSSAYVSADNDSVVDEINITVPVSCTMTGTGMDSHSTEIQNGIYQNNIGTTTLHAFCNDNEGFAIYAAGYTGNEIGGTNSNKLVGTTASSNATIVSGIATTAGSPDISNWAMKLAITQDSGDTTSTNAFMIDSAPNVDLPSQAGQSPTQASFSEYHVVPNEYVKVAHKNSMTDMTATTGGVKLTTTYAAYISKTQPADTYSGQVIYALVHPAYANVEGCNPGGTTISTILCMQDLSTTNKSSILASMVEEQTYYLKDKRDGKYYAVSKLKDGNVWMTQNLDLDLDSSKTYTNKDTDIGWNGVSYDAASWTPSSATRVTSDTDWKLGSIGSTTPDSYDPGELYWNGVIIPEDQSNCEAAGGVWVDEWVCDGLDPVSPTGDPYNHLGNYYNWTAAVAMNDSSNYGVYDEGVDAIVNTEADQSICPVGWTLPLGRHHETIASIGSFQYLFEQYGWAGYDYDIMTNPYIWDSAIRLPLSGVYYGGGILDSSIGQDSRFWSLNVKNSSQSYAALSGFEYDVFPSLVDSRYQGHSVRCVAR